MKTILISCALAAAALSQAGSYSFRSGNAAIGSLDPNTIFAPVSNSTALTYADFNNALGGAHATVIGYYPGAWEPNLQADPSAEWISTDGSQYAVSALYATKLIVPEYATTATLHLDFSVDNTLGNLDTGDVGVYLNGHAIATAVVGGSFGQDYTFDSGEISQYLYNGDNFVELGAYNSGGPGGFIFSGTITTQAVPEPASVAALGLGAFGLLRRRRKA